jgi:hypothetical protein
MPQAPNHLRAMFSDDADAWRYLPNFYDDRGIIRPKIAGTEPTEKQGHAIDYLCLEWDYGYESQLP